MARGSWFDGDTTAAGPSTSSAPPQTTSGVPDFGNPVYNQIGQIMYQATGQVPTLKDVSQWGTNVDANYLAKIRQAINATPQAQTHQQQPATAPAAPAAAPAVTGPKAGSISDPSAFGKAWLASGGKTVADLQNFVKAHPEFAATLGGSKGDKVTIGGQTFDAVLSAGLGGRGATWDAGGGGGGGTPGTAANPVYTPPAWTGGPPPAFQAPTNITEQNDPGFQARLKLGADALQRSAAAQGSLLTGGTLKDLNAFAQDFGSNEFGQVYNRALTNYQQGQLNPYLTKYQQYLDSIGTGLNAFNTNFGVDTNLWNRANLVGQQGFGNNLSLAQLGLQATGIGANAGATYGNQAGSLITGAGNANAAGQVASGNAWANGLGQVTNFASLYPYLRNGGGAPTQDWGYVSGN